jgi:hypothetical protein
MTTVTPPTPTGEAGDDPQAPLVAEEPRRPRRRSRWWRIGYPLAIVALALAIPVLVVVGMRIILDSTDGQLVRRVTDPADPGYEAVVEPTPTALIVNVDAAGSLDSGAVLARTSDGVGGILTIPAGTLVPGGISEVPLRYVYDTEGVEAYASAVGNLLGLTFGEVRVVGADEWESLVAPAAPITVNSPDPVIAADGTVQFPRGSLELTAAEVWPFLSGRDTGESDLARMVRVQAFWSGWLARIGTTGASGLGIPTDSGIGLVLADLSDDQVRLETLPVTSVGDDVDGNERFAVDPDAAADAVAAIVPFPEGPPGTRPRLRVLDGTGELDNGVSAAIVLAAAGAQIDVVGNARSFGQATTQFVYYDDAQARAAEDLRDALGVGEVVRSEQTNSATDLTVVLGEDYVAAVGVDPSAVAEPSTLGDEDG